MGAGDRGHSRGEALMAGESTSEERLAILESEQRAIRDEVAKNTCVTQAVKADTEELITLLKGAKVFAGLLKWGVSIAAACVAVWATLKGGR